MDQAGSSSCGLMWPHSGKTWSSLFHGSVWPWSVWYERAGWRRSEIPAHSSGHGVLGVHGSPIHLCGGGAFSFATAAAEKAFQHIGAEVERQAAKGAEKKALDAAQLKTHTSRLQFSEAADLRRFLGRFWCGDESGVRASQYSIFFPRKVY